MQETSLYDSLIVFYKENYNYLLRSQTKINNDTHGKKQHNLQQSIRPIIYVCSSYRSVCSKSIWLRVIVNAIVMLRQIFRANNPTWFEHEGYSSDEMGFNHQVCFNINRANV